MLCRSQIERSDSRRRCDKTRLGWRIGGAGVQFVGCRRDATWRARVKTRRGTDGIGVWNASEMREDGMKL